MAFLRLIWGQVKEVKGLTPGLWKRAMAIEIDSLKDKETAEEAVFISKQEETLLRKLLKKVKKQADASDQQIAVHEATVELSTLKEILGNYNISDEDLQAVLKWKYED